MAEDNRLVLRQTNDETGEESGRQTISVEDQPRQPRNMEDLLRYAIEAESLGGGQPVSHHDPGPLDPERREFLESVISSMTVDVVKELKECLSVLESPYEPGNDIDKYQESFEQIIDLIDNIDLANDFCKLGGFEICKTWIQRDSTELRWRAANAIGESCQNNPYCQDRAVEYGLLKILMDCVTNDPDENVKLKSFQAISCIVRNNENSLLKFLSLNGHKLILNCLKLDSNRLKIKTLFFISAIANKEGMLHEQLWDIGLVNLLIGSILKSNENKLLEDVSYLEQTLSALLSLLKDSKKKLQNKEELVRKLSDIERQLSQQPAFMESLEYIKSIKNILS